MRTGTTRRSLSSVQRNWRAPVQIAWHVMTRMALLSDRQIATLSHVLCSVVGPAPGWSLTYDEAARAETRSLSRHDTTWAIPDACYMYMCRLSSLRSM